MTPVGAGRDDPFRSAPLRIPEAPKAPPRPWLTRPRLRLLRHAVMIEGTAVMFLAMLFPIQVVRVQRLPTCTAGDGYHCTQWAASIHERNPAAELRTGVMLALVVTFAGFLLGHTHWLVRPPPDRPDDTRWARRGAFVALMYAAAGFLVTGFVAPFSLERPVLAPVFLALCVVTVVTRTE